MMFRFFIIIASSAIILPGTDTTLNLKKEKTCKAVAVSNSNNEIISVCNASMNQESYYVFDRQLYDYKCDFLPQVIFWRKIMNLTKDSALLTSYSDRQLLSGVEVKDWEKLGTEAVSRYKDSLRASYCLSDSERILFVEGKRFFYDFEKSFQNLNDGIRAFRDNGVDPWYAQAILLIESPNKLQKSNAGAYGPFQLMKPVARMFGLKVNRLIDERADFSRSAYASSSLLKTICIPLARTMLDTLCISYNEQDLWFRLLVMHVYHAGAGNVRAALEKIAPVQGGMELIATLWHTQAKGFKSSSQNYSQLALAAMLEMNARLNLSRLSLRD